MSDDHQEPRRGRAPEERWRGVPAPKNRPPADRPATAGDATAEGETADGATSDAATVRRTEPVSGEPVRPANTAWSGRAEVPAPRPGRPEQPVQWYVEDQGDRQWWMPILVASVALVLLAAVGFGLWLVAGPGEESPGAPLPAPSADSPSTGPITPPDATVTTPAVVSMPDLVGMSQAAAEDELDRIGLGYRSHLRPSDQPVGTVIDTDPRPGERVQVGTDVTLMISEGAATTRPPTGSPTPSATPSTPSASPSTPAATPSAPAASTGGPSGGASR